MAALLFVVCVLAGANLFALGWWVAGRRTAPENDRFSPRDMAEVLRSATMNATKDSSELAVALVEKVGESLARAVRESIAVPQPSGPRLELSPTGEVLVVDGDSRVPWFQQGDGWDPSDELVPDPDPSDPSQRAILVESGVDLLAEIRAMPAPVSSNGFPSLDGELL